MRSQIVNAISRDDVSADAISRDDVSADAIHIIYNFDSFTDE